MASHTNSCGSVSKPCCSSVIENRSSFSMGEQVTGDEYKKNDTGISTVQNAKCENTVREDFVFKTWPKNLGPSVKEVIQFMQSTAFRSSAPLKKPYVFCYNFGLKLRLYYRKVKTMLECSVEINSVLMSRVERRTSAGAKKAALYQFVAKIMSFSGKKDLNSSNLSKPLTRKSPLKSSEQKFTDDLEDPETNSAKRSGMRARSAKRSGMRTRSANRKKSYVSSGLTEDKNEINSSDDEKFSSIGVFKKISVTPPLRRKEKKKTGPALNVSTAGTSEVSPQAERVAQDSMQSRDNCAGMSLQEQLKENYIVEGTKICTGEYTCHFYF